MSTRPNAGERLPCSVCGEKIGVYVPRGGDGSLVLTLRHNERKGVVCDGTRRPPATLTNTSEDIA